MICAIFGERERERIGRNRPENPQEVAKIFNVRSNVFYLNFDDAAA